MALGFLFCAAWVTMLIAAGTPTARLFRAILVIAPARWLAGLERRSVVAVAVLLLIAATLALVADGEAVRIFAFGAPELANLLVLLDISALFDIAVAAVVSASTVGLRSLALWRPRLRRRSRQQHTRPRVPANDEDGPARLFAAA